MFQSVSPTSINRIDLTEWAVHFIHDDTPSANPIDFLCQGQPFPEFPYTTTVKPFKSSLWAVALLGIIFCAGCNNTQPAAPLPAVKVAARPAIKPTAKPTAHPTPTRAERRKAAREKAKAERLAKREKLKAEAATSAKAAYDVPALLGKTIEQIHAKLGPVEDSGPEDDDGEKSWSNSKGGLLVHYDIATRDSTSFFVNGQYGQPLTDKSQFLVIGNLREDDPRYTLEFVPLLGSETEWMGVRVIPR